MKFKIKIHTQILIAIVVGVAIGFLLNRHIEHAHVVGEGVARSEVVCGWAEAVKLKNSASRASVS